MDSFFWKGGLDDQDVKQVVIFVISAQNMELSVTNYEIHADLILQTDLI